MEQQKTLFHLFPILKNEGCEIYKCLQSLEMTEKDGHILASFFICFS